jgi:hypothetical protein
MPALRFASCRAHVQPAGAFRRQASRLEHYLIIWRTSSRYAFGNQIGVARAGASPRKSRRVLIPDVRYRPIAVIQENYLLDSEVSPGP